MCSVCMCLTVVVQSIRKDMRAALLASKRAVDSSALSNREELLRSSAVREKQDLNEQVAYVTSLFPYIIALVLTDQHPS